MVLEGRYDMSACGGNCDGVLGDAITDIWSGAKPMNVTGDLPTGHTLNLHFSAQEAFSRIFTFLSDI